MRLQVERLLAKAPQERPANALTVRQALEAAASGEDERSTIILGEGKRASIKPLRTRWKLMGVSILLVVLGIGSLMWVGDRLGLEELIVKLPPVTNILGEEPTGEKDKSPKIEDARIKDHLALGTFHLDRGEYSEALAEFEKAKSIDPENKEVLDHLERAKEAWEAEKQLFSESMGALARGRTSASLR